MNDSLTFLGTSDGLPSVNRYHAAILARLAGQTILLDAGEPCSHTLKRMQFDFQSLDGIVLTHTHSDHSGGFPMLLQSLWLEQRTRPLPVWLPRRAIRPLRKWLDACYLFEEHLPFRVDWQPLDPRTRIRIGPLRLRVFPTTHLDATRVRFRQKYRQVGFAAFAVRLEAGSRRIAYSGDLGKADDLVKLCAEPLDVLVCELAHFHPRRLVEVLHARPIQRILITHLGRPMRARLAEVKTCLSELGRGRVKFVRDGDVVRL